MPRFEGVLYTKSRPVSVFPSSYSQMIAEPNKKNGGLCLKFSSTHLPFQIFSISNLRLQSWANQLPGRQGHIRGEKKQQRNKVIHLSAAHKNFTVHILFNRTQ